MTAGSFHGFQFLGWSGDVTSAENPLTITMISSRHVVANFLARRPRQVIESRFERARPWQIAREAAAPEAERR